jgi:hypothetical protein
MVQHAVRVEESRLISVMMTFGWRIASHRLGLAAILCGLLWCWHVWDKSQAVISARSGYVLQVQLAEVQAKLDELRRRAAVAADANALLQEKMQVAEGQALRFASELKAFENETDINPDGLVDGDILKRLRSN